MDFLGLAGEHLDDAVEEEAEGDAVGDGVAQRHEDAGEEGGHGLLQVASSRSRWKLASIMMPTMTSAGAVAAEGMAETKEARKAEARKSRATDTLVRPVRPPALMPAADST